MEIKQLSRSMTKIMTLYSQAVVTTLWLSSQIKQLSHEPIWSFGGLTPGLAISWLHLLTNTDYFQWQHPVSTTHVPVNPNGQSSAFNVATSVWNLLCARLCMTLLLFAPPDSLNMCSTCDLRLLTPKLQGLNWNECCSGLASNVHSLKGLYWPLKTGKMLMSRCNCLALCRNIFFSCCRHQCGRCPAAGGVRQISGTVRWELINLILWSWTTDWLIIFYWTCTQVFK